MTPRTCRAPAPGTTPPAPHPRARPAGRAPASAAVLLLPPALEAFHILHNDVYSAYAHAHLPEDAAATAVRTTFRALNANWPYLLDQPNLTALAWEELVLRSQSRRHPLPLANTSNPLQYDAVVLTQLGLTPQHIADATGQHISTIRYLLTPRT
ncbi:hypothetical protein [Streptomyces sp. NPDC094049]|uniref:hypothetical protein n=1 Tax=Streptomyces sp. NPDC094049 TaxID=3154987 RepID=UPI003320A55E